MKVATATPPHPCLLPCIIPGFCLGLNTRRPVRRAGQFEKDDGAWFHRRILWHVADIP